MIKSHSLYCAQVTLDIFHSLKAGIADAIASFKRMKNTSSFGDWAVDNLIYSTHYVRF